MRFPFGRRRKLSVLTWNVWFGLEKPHRRWTELLATVRRLRPDVVAFQEVTAPFLEMLRKEPWVKKSYAISDPRGESIRAYGNVIMTTLPVGRIEVHPLESEMERKAVVVEARCADSDWAFASVHLDSFRKSAGVRAGQLDRVVDIMSPFDNALILGDFNFCSSWAEENERIPSAYTDLWPVLHSDDGFTVDTDVNEMRRRVAEEDKRVRFDRILLRSPDARPLGAELVGTKRIRGEEPHLFPSDHFGVFGTLHL